MRALRTRKVLYIHAAGIDTCNINEQQQGASGDGAGGHVHGGATVSTLAVDCEAEPQRGRGQGVLQELARSDRDATAGRNGPRQRGAEQAAQGEAAAADGDASEKAAQIWWTGELRMRFYLGFYVADMATGGSGVQCVLRVHSRLRVRVYELGRDGELRAAGPRRTRRQCAQGVLQLAQGAGDDHRR